jgi:acetyl-CoA carboxylase biotin carboxyl carrier protein
MKIDEIKTIVQMMSENDLTEFKIEAEEMILCIRRGSQREGGHTTLSMPSIMSMSAPAAPAPAAAPAAAAPAADNGKPRKTIDAPIVGTFYRAASPDTPAFVKVGDTVTAETVVCIIEAMKVMNEIKAEKSGVIKEVLVENAQAVEFGQPLFVIE